MCGARKSGGLSSHQGDTPKENKSISSPILGRQAVNIDEKDFFKLLFVLKKTIWKLLLQFW